MLTWCTCFYTIFVSYLELVSELTGSQERRFYHRWWNAVTMEEFWRWWNLPVHRWCVKHVYLPLIGQGGGKVKAMAAVFLLSAALHEFLISGLLFNTILLAASKLPPDENFNSAFFLEL